MNLNGRKFYRRSLLSPAALLKAAPFMVGSILCRARARALHSGHIEKRSPRDARDAILLSDGNETTP